MSVDALAGVSGVTRQLEIMALHAYDLRQRVIANNIANIDAEGYKPLRVDFEDQLGPLREAIARGDAPERISALASAIRPQVEAVQTDSVLTGDSAENLDDQMVAMTQNTLDYEAMLTAIARLDGLNQLAISGA